MGVLKVGVCTVSNPVPERSAALADNMAAPAILRCPAMSNAWPNVPLCASMARGCIRCLMPSSVTMLLLSRLTLQPYTSSIMW